VRLRLVQQETTIFLLCLWDMGDTAEEENAAKVWQKIYIIET